MTEVNNVNNAAPKNTPPTNQSITPPEAEDRVIDAQITCAQHPKSSDCQQKTTKAQKDLEGTGVEFDRFKATLKGLQAQIRGSKPGGGDPFYEPLKKVDDLINQGQYDEAINKLDELLTGSRSAGLWSDTDDVLWALSELGNAHYLRALTENGTPQDLRDAEAIYASVLGLGTAPSDISADTAKVVQIIGAKRAKFSSIDKESKAKMHYSLGDIYKQTGRYPQALNEFDAASSLLKGKEDSDIYQQSKAGEAETRILMAENGDDPSQIDTALGICRDIISKKPKTSTVLGRLLMDLGWAYSIKGKIAEDNNDPVSSKKYYLAAAAIYGAFINSDISGLSPVIDGEGLNDIISVIGNNRKNLLAKDTLKRLMTSEAKIMFYEASAYAGAKEYEIALSKLDAILAKDPQNLEAKMAKADVMASWAKDLLEAGEKVKALRLFEEAIGAYTDILNALPQEDPARAKVRVGLAEIEAKYAEELINMGDSKKAAELLDDAEQSSKMVLAQNPSNNLLILRAAFALNYALSLKAKLARGADTKEGKEQLRKIAALNGAMLPPGEAINDSEIAETVSGDPLLAAAINTIASNRNNITSKEMLRKVRSDINDVRFKYAEALKQLGENDTPKYQKAVGEYNIILQSSPNHLGAKLGKAEALLPLAQEAIDNGHAEDARKDVEEAQALLSEVISRLGSKDLNAKGQAQLLRALISLAWSFNIQGNLKGDDESLKTGDYSAALVLLRALLGRKEKVDEPTMNAAVAQAKAYGIDLNMVLSLIGRNNAICSKENMEKFGIPQFKIMKSYIGNLVGLGRYDEAEKEINGFLDEAKARGENALVGQLYSTLGDIYLWKRGDSKKAQDNYQAALSYFAKATNEDVRFETLNARYGLGFALENLKNLTGAETEFKNIISELEGKKLNPKEADLLTRTYLALGDLYVYKMRKADLAAAAFDKAREHAAKPMLKAQASFGLAEVGRILKKDKEGAVANYQQALNESKDIRTLESKKLKAKTYYGLGAIDQNLVKDYNSAIDNYDTASELVGKPKDKEEKQLKNRIDTSRSDSIIDRSKTAPSLTTTLTTESSSHKDSKSGDTTKTDNTIKGVEFDTPVNKSGSVHFTLGVNSQNPNTKITMNGGQLINKAEGTKDYPYILDVPSYVDPATSPYIYIRDYTKEDVNNAYDTLNGKDLELLRTKDMYQGRLGMYYQTDIGSNVHIKPEVSGQLTSVTSQITNYSFGQYPDPKTLTSSSKDDTFQSLNLGVKVPVNIDINIKGVPNTLSFEGGGNVLYKNEPYGTYAVDKNALQGAQDNAGNNISGNDKLITALQDAITGMNKQLAEDPDLTPQQRQDIQTRIQNFNDEITWLDTQSKGKLTNDQSDAKDTLKEWGKNKPLTSYYGQVVWSTTIPLGTENKTLGYGPTVSVGYRFDHDEISPTWNGYWRLNEKPEELNKNHVLFGVSDKLYLPGGVVAPVSASYSMPLGPKDGSNLNASIDFIFTNASKYGITPEIGVTYDNYNDNLNSSQKAGAFIRLNFK